MIHQFFAIILFSHLVRCIVTSVSQSIRELGPYFLIQLSTYLVGMLLCRSIYQQLLHAFYFSVALPFVPQFPAATQLE
jgi:hypothetical protein